ncbi:putative reverse transcriptase domain-containing protein, partial [Tanacetum coccineum]
VPADAEAPLEDQPLPADASPTALSPGYVVDSDPEEDPEEDHADYLADEGDDDDDPFDDDDDDTDDEDEEPFEDEDDDEEEEHLAPADSSAIPVVDLVPSVGDTEAFETDESVPTPRSPQTKVPFAQTHLRRARKTVRLEPSMSPSMEARIAKYAAAPTPPSLLHLPPPVPTSLPLPSSPLPLPPSSLHLPPPVPTSLPLPSSPLPPLPSSLFMPPPVDRREDIPEAKLPPCKRLCLTALTLRYEVGEISTVSSRPTRDHRIDYGFIGTLDAETRRQRAEEVSYGIRDVWVDPTEAVKEVASMTLEGVNTRVTELAAVQEQDIQDFHYETARLLDREALVSREAWAYSVGLSSTHVSELQGQLSAALGQIQNNMPPRRTSAATARAAARAAAAAAAAVEQLIEERVSAALANHETLRNSTNGVVVLSQWFEKMELVFHISNYNVENQVKFATCTFLGNALTWWNSHMKTVTQDVAYAMDWKALKKMMTVKYCPRGEIKKLEIELWNLKVKEEVKKYVGASRMIRVNVMSYQPIRLRKGNKFANESDDQKVLTITERQAEQKRKLEFNAGNNQGHQQQNKRHNTERDYTAGPGEKREYTGSLPLCTKCNYHHKGPCAPRCNKWKKIGHLARDCRSSGPNSNIKHRGQGLCGGNTGTNSDSNVVTGTFLLNDRYASILFDTGADRSFASTTFSSLIDITPTTLDHYYDVELADGKIIGINTIIRGCTLNFLDHPFNINLMPVELGIFDVIIAMYWLSKYHALIDCAKKVVRIPWGNKTLIIHGDGSNQGSGTRLNIISCTKTHKYLLKGHHVFLAHVTTKETEDKSGEKRLEDVPIV